MASLAQLSAEDYFRIHFQEREAELVHGVLMERPMPDFFHSVIQGRLVHMLIAALAGWRQYSVCPELRMRLGPDLVRIPDVCVIDYHPDPDTAPTRAPLLAVEIVSKDDGYTGLLTRLGEYRAWDVPHIWLIDPRLRQLAVFGDSGLVQVEQLELPQFGFAVKMEDLLPRE